MSEHVVAGRFFASLWFELSDWKMAGYCQRRRDSEAKDMGARLLKLELIKEGIGNIDPFVANTSLIAPALGDQSVQKAAPPPSGARQKS